MRFRCWLPALMLLTCLLPACKDLDITPGLPEATQEGKNTFGCMVDGKLWLPYAEHTLDSEVEGEHSTGWFGVRAEQEKNPLQYIWLQLADSTGGLKLKTYSLDEGFSAYLESYTNGVSERYDTGPGNDGSITITKLEPRTGTAIGGVSRSYTIVSGTFSFSATSATTGKAVRITEGRFDVQAF